MSNNARRPPGQDRLFRPLDALSSAVLDAAHELAWYQHEDTKAQSACTALEVAVGLSPPAETTTTEQRILRVVKHLRRPRR